MSAATIAKTSAVGRGPVVTGWGSAVSWAVAAGAQEDELLAAWSWGRALAAPTGKGWDMVRVLTPVGREVLGQFRSDGVVVGPVLGVPPRNTVEFVVPAGTVRSWPSLPGVCCVGLGGVSHLPAPHLAEESGRGARCGRSSLTRLEPALVPTTDSDVLREHVLPLCSAGPGSVLVPDSATAGFGSRWRPPLDAAALTEMLAKIENWEPLDGDALLDDVATALDDLPPGESEALELARRLDGHLARLTDIAFASRADHDAYASALVGRGRALRSQPTPACERETTAHLRRLGWVVSELMERLVEMKCLKAAA